jgi:hypothetical protein
MESHSAVKKSADKISWSPSIAAKKVICPLFIPMPMALGDSLYFRAKHTLRLIEIAEMYRSKGYTILGMEINANRNGELDLLLEKDGLHTVAELKTKWRIESWDIFQAILYTKPGMAVDLIDGSGNIGKLNPDRVEEIRDLLIRRLGNQIQEPVPSKLCRYCSNARCMYNSNFKMDADDGEKPMSTSIEGASIG